MLVVDGGASMRCALLGDNIAEMAYKNGWSVCLCGPGPTLIDPCCHAVQNKACAPHLSTNSSQLCSWSHVCMQGIIINGCIRDSVDIATMPLGVKVSAIWQTLKRLDRLTKALPLAPK